MFLVGVLSSRGANCTLESAHILLMLLALLNNDLTIAQQNVVVLEQDNLNLQVEVERFKTRSVQYLEHPRKDNGIDVIQKIMAILIHILLFVGNKAM